MDAGGNDPRESGAAGGGASGGRKGGESRADGDGAGGVPGNLSMIMPTMLGCFPEASVAFEAEEVPSASLDASDEAPPTALAAAAAPTDSTRREAASTVTRRSLGTPVSGSADADASVFGVASESSGSAPTVGSLGAAEAPCFGAKSAA